jgi:hypothetical protein
MIGEKYEFDISDVEKYFSTIFSKYELERSEYITTH